MSQFWFVVFVAAVVIALVGGFHVWQWFSGRIKEQMTNLDRQ